MVHLEEKGLRCVTFKCGKIEEEIERILGQIKSETIRVTCDQVISRLRRVIIEKGGYTY